MKKLYDITGRLLLVGVLVSCNGNHPPESHFPVDTVHRKGTYGYDLDFIQKNSRQVLELHDSSGQSKILLCASYQGRVLTSTASGDTGSSFGWINYDLISSGQTRQAFNPYGGEERFWIGPEGGQYSFYFKKGDSFNIRSWRVPGLIDTASYRIVRSSAGEAEFQKDARITNYSGTIFEISITRKVRLLDKPSIEEKIQTSIPDKIRYVGFESSNQIANSGNEAWTREKGLMSIWLLGMMTPTPQTKVFIPFRSKPDARSYITDNYFGIVPADRLLEKDSILYFRCDGAYRSKIGISPKIAKPIAASFDFSRNILTLLFPEVQPDGSYVNSKCEMQKHPFEGDVINSYNDGPLQDGSQLGPFYEIESSSPARELRPGESEGYRQTTCHFQGDYDSLRKMVLHLMKVDLDEIKKW